MGRTHEPSHDHPPQQHNPPGPGITSVPRAELPPERVIARYRSHGRALVWPSLALTAIAAAGGYFLGRFPEEWQNLGAIAAVALLAIVFWLVPTLGWLARRSTITTRRVISVRGLVVRERQEASLLRGFDVTLRRRGLQPLVRSGDVTVHSGSEHPLVMKDLPDAGLIVAALTELGDDAYANGRS